MCIQGEPPFTLPAKEIFGTVDFMVDPLRPRSVFIVDGYSTGNFIAPEVRKLGANPVHVRSTDEYLPSLISPKLRAYRHCLTWTGREDIQGLAALRELNPVAVIAGSDPGVSTADALAELLACAGNSSSTSAARRDKFQMIERIREAGLHCAAQIVSDNPEAVVGWSETQGFPVVIKPLSSASSENVRICSDTAEVRSAVADVLHSTTMFGEYNLLVLAQSFLEGTEYIVDSVSSEGHRFTCGVWRYEKRISNGRPLYDRDVLVDPANSEVAMLIDYAERALDALGVLHGPAHVEVMMTEKGPALVEVGARLNGNMNQTFHQQCLGTDQASIAALAALHPDKFREDYAGKTYHMLQGAVVYNTRSLVSGTVESVDEVVLSHIWTLPTVLEVQVRLQPGDELQVTTDLATSPLRVFMLGDADTLESDHDRIERLSENLFRLVQR